MKRKHHHVRLTKSGEVIVDIRADAPRKRRRPPDWTAARAAVAAGLLFLLLAGLGLLICVCHR